MGLAALNFESPNGYLPPVWGPLPVLNGGTAGSTDRTNVLAVMLQYIEGGASEQRLELPLAPQQFDEHHGLVHPGRYLSLPVGVELGLPRQLRPEVASLNCARTNYFASIGNTASQLFGYNNPSTVYGFQLPASPNNIQETNAANVGIFMARIDNSQPLMLR